MPSPNVKPPAPSQWDALVRRELAQAARRLRNNDLLNGGLTIGVVLLAYAAVVMTLDWLFNCSALLRQVLWLGLLATLAGLFYALIWRPLRLVINPRYAARQVEATLPEARNALINWVDLQDANLPATVKAAVAARAASGLSEADIPKATESRQLFWLGSALGLLLATLAVLFIVFKPNPFLSLVNRAFNPFYAGRIAAKTELFLQEPEGGDVTLTSGESLQLRVFVSGSIPDPDSPNRLRVQIRPTPDAKEFDELPLEQLGGSREWGLRLASSVIQNGMWYTILGNDAATPVHQVQVRARPIIKGLEATYTYPPYLRMQEETDRDFRLMAYKGTQVLLKVKANRHIRRGWLQLDSQPELLPAEVLAAEPDAMRFRLTLIQSGSYRLGFTSTDGEASEPTPPYPIKVLEDQPPVITIDRPTEEIVSVPLNGQLELDATFSDDFGLGRITLKIRASDNGEGYMLQDRPHRNGAALPLGADGSAPTRYELKESLPLAELKYLDGKPARFTESQIIEYWYEATDNCEVPKPNVGKSVIKKIRLGRAITLEDDQEAMKKKAEARAQQEQEHVKKQENELKQARRPVEQLRPKEAPKTEPPPKPENTEPGQGQEQPKDGPPAQQPPNQPGQEKTPTTKPKTGANDPSEPGQPGTNEPMSKQNVTPKSGATGQPMSKEQPEAGDPATTPMSNQPREKTEPPKDKTEEPGQKSEPGQRGDAAQTGQQTNPNDEKLDQQARELERKLEQQEREQSGKARREDGERSPESAPMPMSKPGDNSQPSTNPQPEGSNSPPSEGQPEPKGRGKPQPKTSPDAKGPPSQEKPAKPENSEPGTPPPAESKPEPGPSSASPQDKNELSRNTEKPPKGELSRETGRDGEPQEPPADDVERLIRQGEDLNSSDPRKREAAEKEFDQRVGQNKREELQNKLKSQDPRQREEAKRDIDELAKKKKKPEPPKSGTGEPNKDGATQDQPKEGQPKEGQPMPKEGQPKEGGTSKEGQPKEGQPMPKEGQPKEGQPKEGGTSKEGQPKEGQPKEGQSKEGQPMPKEGKDGTKAEPGRESGPGKKPSEEELKQLAEKAQDLASNDPQKRQQAEREFDQMIGQKNREKLQQDLKDLQSNDQKKREDARRRLENQAQEAMKKNADASPKKPPTEQELKDLAEKAKDLQSPDKSKQDAARKELDEKLGQANREKLEDELKKLNSSDPKERQAAEERLKQAAQELAKKNAEKPEKRPSREDVEKFAKEAEKLASKDPQERQAAEKKFDEQLGEEARKQLQKDIEDLKSGDQQRQQEALKRAQEALKNAPPGSLDKKMQLGGRGRTDQEGQKLEDDPRNRLKTAELQLKQFERAKNDPERLKELGYTPQEYERFLKAYEERVKRLREQVAQQAVNLNEKRPDGPATLRVGEGSGGKKLDTRPDGTTGTLSGSGSGTAPPGYTEAQKRFAEEAAKLRKTSDKK